MYWSSSTGEACHDSIGLSSPHMRFYLPDGQTSDVRETWTLVENPNPEAVTVGIVYLCLQGKEIVPFTDELAPGTRKTYKMNDKIASGRASVAVKSLDDARPIMVERSMYWNNRGAGTDTIGAFRETRNLGQDGTGPPPSIKRKGGLQDEEDYAEEMQKTAEQNEYVEDRMDVLLLPADHVKD